MLGSEIVVRRYSGNQINAYAAFQDDAAEMAQEGWYPVGQQYIAGSWGTRAFLIAVLLCVVLVGILIFIYMLLVKPTGVLVVTYQSRGPVRRHEESFEEDDQLRDELWEWVDQVGVGAARRALEADLRSGAISREEYARHTAAIDRMKLD
jgi:hypothetical protein